MVKFKLKDIKQGELFKLKGTDTSPVWIRGEYIRETDKYSTTRFADSNSERLLSGKTEVYIGFTF